MQSTTIKHLARAAALAAFAIAAGCSEEDNTTNNFLAARGNSTRDTIDLNISEDARIQDFNQDNFDDGFFPAQFPVGPSGEIVAHILQQHDSTDPFGSNTLPFNYYRVLGEGPGPIGELDNFADEDYDPFVYRLRAVSYNKRFTALYKGDDDDSDRALVVFDAQTGQYTAETDIFDTSSPAFNSFSGERGLFVDNSGLVTVLFDAQFTSTFTAVFACQFDATTQTITRQPQAVSKPFSGTQTLSNVLAARSAVNGDILIVCSLTTDADTTVESVVYDKSTNTFLPTTTITSDTTLDFELDTDGKSFQFIYTDNPAGNVFTTRFVAETASTFPAATRIDTTGGTTNVDVHFGRDGTSIVDWFQTGSNPGQRFASWSATTVTPSSSRTVELVTGLTTHFEIDYAFDDAGNALIAHRGRVSGDDQLYVNALNRSSGQITPLSTANNIATEIASSANQFLIDGFGLLGYSAGSSPTCVLTWRSRDFLLGQPNVSSQNRVNAVLFTGIVPGVRTELQTRTDFAFDGGGAASTNNAKTSTSYVYEYDQLIDPDSLPAAGSGTSWVTWVQFKPLPGGSGFLRGYAWSFTHGQGALTGAAQGGVVEFGKFGNVRDILALCPSPGGGLSVFTDQFDVEIRYNLNPSPGANQAPSTDQGVVVTPEDLTLSNDTNFAPEGGIHLDGLGFTFNDAGGGSVNASARGGDRIWSLWEGRDIESLRVFGKRTR